MRLPASRYPASDSTASAASCRPPPMPFPHSDGSTCNPAGCPPGKSGSARAAGQAISERHALEALLLPSAGNMAWILARRDAGSQDAFTAKMNATARRLGMTATSYTDPSGPDSPTVSTAAGQVRLGITAMRVPALAAIAAMPTAGTRVPGPGRPSCERGGLARSVYVREPAVAPLCPGPGVEGRPYSAPHPGQVVSSEGEDVRRSGRHGGCRRPGGQAAAQ